VTSTVPPKRVQEAAVTVDAPPGPPSDRGGFFGHPRGLSTLFFTEMWERFSYYGVRPLLILYMAAALADGGFGFTRLQASAIVGIYASSVYLASLPGGWIADRLLGLRRSILTGAALISAGHISIGLSAFLGYATWAAFQNAHYAFGPYLSPFYSPLLPKPVWWPSWLPFVNAAQSTRQIRIW